MPRQIAFQCSGLVTGDVDLLGSYVIIGQFHYIIEVIARAADMEDVDETRVFSRDRLEAGHSLEFALKRALTVERASIDDFDCA